MEGRLGLTRESGGRRGGMRVWGEKGRGYLVTSKVEVGIMLEVEGNRQGLAIRINMACLVIDDD